MRRLSCLVLIALFAAPLAAHADDASKRAKVDEMFSILHLDRVMQQMTSGAQQQARANMNAQLSSSDAATRAKAEEFLNKVFTLINQQLSWQSLEPEMAKIYSDNFTEAQIDDILKFYKSPTGRAMVEKMPQLTNQSMGIAQKRMMDLQPKMKELADQYASQAPKSSTTNAAPASGTKGKQ